MNTIKLLIITLFSKIPFLESIYERILPLRTVSLPNGKKLNFASPNSLIKYRINTFFSKEPQTLDWINSMTAGEVLLDIGANIGLYSIYAGVKGVKVYSFEPDSLNFAILNKNIFLNKLSKTVTAYNVALSANNTLDKIYISQFISGASFHQIDKTLKKTDSHEQGVAILSLDSAVKQLEINVDHLKIDVDGNEKNILLGSHELFSGSKLKSILIEIENINSSASNQLVKMLNDYGFSSTETHFLNKEKTNANFIFKKKS
jgi:FkbM family methyltransferase